MSTLHILSHSPFSDGRFSSCLPLLGDEDALLLSGDAVYALQPHTAPHQQLNTLSSSIALFALAEDVSARHLPAWPARVKLVDYPDFVALCCHYDRVNSWL